MTSATVLPTVDSRAKHAEPMMDFDFSLDSMVRRCRSRSLGLRRSRAASASASASPSPSPLPSRLRLEKDMRDGESGA